MPVARPAGAGRRIAQRPHSACRPGARAGAAGAPGRHRSGPPCCAFSGPRPACGRVTGSAG
ncbi:MAG: hypothetical protein B7X79_19450 [Acidovorax sp. 17-64-282]|nr:MAG: hypothetical protein B7Y64_13590 [Acidovorax sp. 35-64-16]OYY86667.1 MAG: hypothetical protein B7Y46_04590 [Acidovorax sp. 28-64-14]OYZ45333.1 MAG: hypothetical protein B7Y20_07350 [Acidovorax sp. 16-64-162]OZA52342.1 MAG: hypothetical protein B7X79_19450 [Acidovorax sp. 17-64-282]OZA69797.1 MAG: hypothetical protein B7X70_09620 [Acidovorax sp. 39-64-12]